MIFEQHRSPAWKKDSNGGAMTRKYLLYLSCLLLVTIVPVYSGITGKIAGRITDTNTAEPLIGANIMICEKVVDDRIVELSPAEQQGTASDLNGEYFIVRVNPGIYSLRISYIGYQTVMLRDVRVSADLTTRIDCKLSSTIIEANEAVIVTGERKEIQKDLTSSEVSISADRIEEMPVRSVSELISLQAGVTKDSDGELHIRGGRSSEIAYMVDGVRVVDPLNRSSGISIDDQSISELKTITGTFNAEYGQALSGVVNIVTKQGSDRFKLNLIAYMGDYYSADKDIYFVKDNPFLTVSSARYGTGYDNNFAAEGEKSKKDCYLDSYNPFYARDLQVNVSGPIPLTNKRMTYYVSGRYNHNPGYIYGARYFMPWGFQSPISDSLSYFEKADSALVPMREYKGYSTNAKLFFRLSSAINLSYGLYYNHDSGDYGYTHIYKYLPDAKRQYLTDAYTQIFQLTHTLSPSTFYEFKISLYDKNHAHYLYKDPEDYRYMPIESSDFELYVFGPAMANNLTMWKNSYDFSYWGNPVDYTETQVHSQSCKWDMTSQITKRHLAKLGFEVIQYDLLYDNYDIQFSKNDYRPYVPDDSSPFHTNYEAKPFELASYIQDKIEFEELIINLGVRLDYFDANGRILADPADPQIFDPFKMEHIYSNYDESISEDDLVEYTVEEREKFWYKDTAPTYQISPRFGLSFPISDRGVIHFSYGHFFQNPEFQYLFANPNFWIEGAGSENLVGNANLAPERTVMYELGVQQQVARNIYLHLTGFYRDIRDWVGTGSAIDTYSGVTYYKYENKDHAAAKGVTLSGKARTGNLSINLDYTFMTAQGTSSDPKDAYNDTRNDKAPRLTLINLDWDQRHSLSTILNYSDKDWSATLTGTLNSGFPYTPEFARGEVSGTGTFVGLTENSERKPLTYNFDIQISRNFNIGSVKGMASMTVRNILDRRNARYVYADTGLPDYSMDGKNQVDRILEISSVGDYFANPSYYSAPRYIQFGLRFNL